MTIEEILNDSSMTSEDKLKAIALQNSINEMQTQAAEMKATISAWNTEKAENSNSKRLEALEQQIADMKAQAQEEKPDETDNAFWKSFYNQGGSVNHSRKERDMNECRKKSIDLTSMLDGFNNF